MRARAEREMRFAYADPPYPGNSFLYKDHPDYAGEVDHKELLSRLAGYDGWALSTSARALPEIISQAVVSCLGMTIRVACWVRGVRQTSSRYPLNAWEPVVFAGGRRLVRCDQLADVLTYSARPRTTDPARVIGAKPSAFCFWMFDLLGALPGDQFDDLYPGSGGVMRAWECYTSPRARDDASANFTIIEKGRGGILSHCARQKAFEDRPGRGITVGAAAIPWGFFEESVLSILPGRDG